MPLTAETIRLAAAVKADMSALVDEHVDELTKTWVRAWDDYAAEFAKAVDDFVANGGKTADLTRVSRMKKTLEYVATMLDALAAQRPDVAALIARVGSDQAKILASQLPKSSADLVVGWDRVDPKAITWIVVRSRQRIESQTRPIPGEQMARLKREMVKAVGTGDNPELAAKRAFAAAKGVFMGGLARATNIARTEMIDASRNATMASMNANKELLACWEWQATVSPRTCMACLSMHGRQYPLETPGPLGHQQCRCVAIPVTKSWEELGLPVKQPPPLKTRNVDDWFNKLPEVKQRAILGPKGFDAYKAGEFPRDQWATMRQNDGWRPSVNSARPGEKIMLPGEYDG